MDPRSGEPYYLNTHSGKSQWTKPLALKSVKMNFPEWVLMRDEANTVYYRQTIKPNDSSWVKPQSWLLCVTCRVDFPVRRCLDCKTIQCIDCFIATHPNPNFVEDADPVFFNHKFEVVPTIQSYCTMCKALLATKQCVECGCEQYCDKCFGMMHGKSRRKKTSMSSHVDVIDIWSLKKILFFYVSSHHAPHPFTVHMPSTCTSTLPSNNTQNHILCLFPHVLLVAKQLWTWANIVCSTLIDPQPLF